VLEHSDFVKIREEFKQMDKDGDKKIDQKEFTSVAIKACVCCVCVVRVYALSCFSSSSYPWRIPSVYSRKSTQAAMAPLNLMNMMHGSRSRANIRPFSLLLGCCDPVVTTCNWVLAVALYQTLMPCMNQHDEVSVTLIAEHHDVVPFGPSVIIGQSFQFVTVPSWRFEALTVKFGLTGSGAAAQSQTMDQKDPFEKRKVRDVQSIVSSLVDTLKSDLSHVISDSIHKLESQLHELEQRLTHETKQHQITAESWKLSQLQVTNYQNTIELQKSEINDLQELSTKIEEPDKPTHKYGAPFLVPELIVHNSGINFERVFPIPIFGGTVCVRYQFLQQNVRYAMNIHQLCDCTGRILPWSI